MESVKGFVIGTYVVMKILVVAAYMRLRYGAGAGTLFLNEVTNELNQQIDDKDEVEKLINETERRINEK